MAYIPTNFRRCLRMKKIFYTTTCPKKQQYWRTPYDTKKLLDIPNIKRLNEREKIEMIELWRRRWIEGMWFFSNGEPKYLTGLHMDHLVFNTFNSKKLMYFDDERFIFYFVDLTENASRM
jgi:hypothetical protein